MLVARSRRVVDAPRRLAFLVVAALSLAGPVGCGASSLYGDSNGTVRGAVDALRRTGADPLEPDRIDEMTAAVMRGLLRGAGQHDSLQGLVRATVEDVVRGLREELQRAVATLLIALDATLTGDATHAHGLLNRAIADLDPQLQGDKRSNAPALLARIRQSLQNSLICEVPLRFAPSRAPAHRAGGARWPAGAVRQREVESEVHPRDDLLLGLVGEHDGRPRPRPPVASPCASGRSSKAPRRP